MGRKKTVLRNDGWRQREFRCLARHEIEVGGLLRILGHDLDEAGVIHAVIVIVATMHVERRLGNGAATHVEHVRQALAGRGI